MTVTRRPVPDDLFGGRLRGAYLIDLEVVAIDDLAPHVRAVTVGSSDLLGFEFSAGQDLMIEFPDGRGSVRRRYTIRRADPGQGTLDLEFELHRAGGVAVPWARVAAKGMHLDAIGPRGNIALRPLARSHVFVADDSAMPAAFAMIEALPPHATAVAFLVTPHGELSRPGPDADGSAELVWVDRLELPEALARFDPGPDMAGYVNGERRLVGEVVEVLVAAGMQRPSVASKSYWRSDKPNAPHGKPIAD